MKVVVFLKAENTNLTIAGKLQKYNCYREIIMTAPDLQSDKSLSHGYECARKPQIGGGPSLNIHNSARYFPHLIFEFLLQLFKKFPSEHRTNFAKFGTS